MPQSLSFVVLHLVFSTKDRRPFLQGEISERLHAYLATVARDKECEAFRVGGMPDHVHLALRLSRNISASELIKTLKAESSKWLKRQSSDFEEFSWQRGYGCFSVGRSDLDKLITYISNQEEHHSEMSFEDELRLLLRRYEVDYDERYVWD